MIRVQFSANPDQWNAYRAPLYAAFAELELQVDLAQDHAPDQVDYIVFAPNGPISDFRPFSRTKAVLSLWAGVETVVTNATLTQPLLRMVDTSLTQGMVEWVTGHVLRHHLGMDQHIQVQDGVWRNADYPPLASERPVTILGMGALGLACGTALQGLGFAVTGWSKSPKAQSALRLFHGDDGLQSALKDAQIVVLLLPDTPDTTDIINDRSLDLLAKGAVIINPGRGPLIADTALLAALDTGQVSHATLDVFRQEPLPADHPFWAHPHITVTPHIAAATRPETAARVIAAQILRGETGQPYLHQVNRTAGY